MMLTWVEYDGTGLRWSVLVGKCLGYFVENLVVFVDDVPGRWHFSVRYSGARVVVWDSQGRP